MATNQLVHDASAFPWNAVVLIRVTFPDGSQCSGSGAIVGDNDILTASHIVYSAEHGGAATEITLYPGFDDESPLDEYLTGGYRFNFFELPARCTDATYVDDYALIGVETRFHSWFGLSSAYYAHYDRLSVQQSGYDGLIADWYGCYVQGYSTGSVYRDGEYWVSRDLALNPGDSGSPIWCYDGYRHYVIAVESHGNSIEDKAVPIDADTFRQITTWMAGNDDLMRGPRCIIEPGDYYGDGEYFGTVQRDLIAEKYLVTVPLEGSGLTGALVHGSDGLDALLAKGTQPAYAWERDPSGSVALYNGATNEGYGLEQVERVIFADGAHAVAFDTEAHAGQAYRLYKAAFDRVPDKPGLGYWIDRLDGAMDLIEVSARFIDSPEFRSLYGTGLANRGFVEKLYENILDRLPDPAGIDWWVNQLDLGARTREKVLADFSESPENQGNVIALIGNGIEYVPWYG